MMHSTLKKELYPYPDGWFCLDDSKNLANGELKTYTFMGKEVVLYRGESGQIYSIDAYCPHLGGHFGHGGKVQGENIQCPFHGFCFDGKGTCVSAYDNGAKPPPLAKAQTWPIEDKNGFILLFHSNEEGVEPFDIPDISFDGWLDTKVTSFKIQSHPQETTENSVDIGHFEIVHGYSDVAVETPLSTDGPYLHTRYAIEREHFIPGSANTVRAAFDIHVYGLGYSYVEVEIPELEIELRNFILSTPISDGMIELRLGQCVKSVANPKKIHPLLSFLPRSLVNYFVSKGAFEGYVHDVKQDFHIWENKAYVAPPALAKGDGPIGKYRNWVKQFYPNNQPFLSPQDA